MAFLRGRAMRPELGCLSYCGAQSTIALEERENQSNFGQRFRLSAVEFTPQQEIKRKQIGSALGNSAVEAG
jgi:hypothetical protein